MGYAVKDAPKRRRNADYKKVERSEVERLQAVSILMALLPSVIGIVGVGEKDIPPQRNPTREGMYITEQDVAVGILRKDPAADLVVREDGHPRDVLRELPDPKEDIYHIFGP